MLFHVAMTVRIPNGMNSVELDRLTLAEKSRAQQVQRTGTWRHLWRAAGRYSNISIFEVHDPAELHQILSGLPLFPFMEIEVSALCRHPSSIHDDDR